MPKIDLPHVFARAFNSPLLIAEGKLDAILSGIGNRVISGDAAAGKNAPEPEASAGPDRRFNGGGYLMDNGIAVLPIVGTMVRRGSWMDSESGLTSYAKIKRSVAEMLADGAVRGIMLEVDSYGGEAGGVFELADWIRDAASAAGKPIRVHVNEAAASAAYAIASAAEFISTPATGEVGSIGVVCAHVDVSEADKKAGHKWTYIYAGAKKVDGNPHEPLDNSVKAELQADINFLYEMFAGIVARNRGIDAEAVKGTEAALFRGEQAVSAGLADAVMTFDEAIAGFARRLDLQAANPNYVFMRGGKMPNPNEDKPNVSAEAEKPEAVETEAASEAEAAPEDAATPAAAAPAQPVATPVSPDAIAAERARFAELVKIEKQAARLGVSFDLAAAVAGGVTAEAARKTVMDSAAAVDEASAGPVAHAPHMATAPGKSNEAEIKAGYDEAIAKAAAAAGLKI